MLAEIFWWFLGGRLEARLGYCECTDPGTWDPIKDVFSSSLSRRETILFSEAFLCLRPSCYGTGGLCYMPKFYCRVYLF